jgi:MFS family permease
MSDQKPSQSASAAASYFFGPQLLKLQIDSSVSKFNVSTLLFGSFFGIAMMSFINVCQPYLFTEVLKIPLDEQAPLAGDLTFWSEVVVIATIGLLGAMSDKIGRKPIWVGAFLVFALGYFLYPLAESPEQLLLFRMIFAVGLAANTAMLPLVANDYPAENSRGKMISVCFMLNGLGFIILMTPLRELSGVFEGLTDGDPEQTARLWIWTAASVCLFVSTGLMLGLKAGSPAQLKKRDPLLSTLKIGVHAAKKLRVALAYVAAVVARGDMAVLSAFFVLWLTQEGIAAGMDTGEATRNAIKFYIFIQVFALLWLPILGYILDRIDRVAGLAIAMVLAGGGYSSLFLLDDPLSSQMWFCAVLIGMGEISANLASLTLIGSEAPVKGRGAVLGLFSLCGAVGILIIAKGGGMLSVDYGTIAPFALVAVMNLVVLILALIVLKISRNDPEKVGSF